MEMSSIWMVYTRNIPGIYMVYPRQWIYMVYPRIYMVYPQRICIVYTWYIHGISFDRYTWYILGYPWISLDIPVFLNPDFLGWPVLLVSCNAHMFVGDQQCFIAWATLAIVPGEKVVHKRLNALL